MSICTEFDASSLPVRGIEFMFMFGVVSDGDVRLRNSDGLKPFFFGFVCGTHVRGAQHGVRAARAGGG